MSLVGVKPPNFGWMKISEARFSTPGLLLSSVPATTVKGRYGFSATSTRQCAAVNMCCGEIKVPPHVYLPATLMYTW